MSENIVLTYTFASNVGVLVATAPLFTAILVHFLLQGERLYGRFVVGFVIAITGIYLFLGLGASALCFACWNWAVGILGAVKTGFYIYAQPVVTVAASALIPGENITPIACVGALLTLAGLYIS